MKILCGWLATGGRSAETDVVRRARWCAGLGGCGPRQEAELLAHALQPLEGGKEARHAASAVAPSSDAEPAEAERHQGERRRLAAKRLAKRRLFGGADEPPGADDEMAQRIFAVEA